MSTDKKSTDAQAQGLIAGAVSLTVSVLLVKLLGFIYKLPLSYILADEGMGYFNTAYTVFTFFYMLCSAGIPRAVSILVTEMNAKGNPLGAREIYRYTLRIFALFGFLLTLCMLLFSQLLAKMIGNSYAWFSMLCIAPSLFFVSVGGVARGYLNGLGRLAPIAVSQVAEGVVKFVFGLFFALLGVRCGFDIFIVSGLTVLGVTLGSLASMLYMVICSKNAFTQQKAGQNYNFDFLKKGILKKIISIAAPITLTSAITGLSSMIDLSLIMKRLGNIGYSEAQASALYGNFTTLVVPILNLIVSLISPLTVAALPMLTSGFVLDNREELDKSSRFLIRLCGAISIPCSVGCIFFSEEFLKLLFDDSSAEVAAPLLVMIAPAVCFLPLLTMVNTSLEASRHTKAPLLSMSLGAAIKIAISYIMIGNPDIGIMGAPIGTSISYAVSFIVSSLLMLKYTDIKFSVFASLWKPLLLSFISLGGARILYLAISKETFSAIKFAACAALAVVIYVVFSFVSGVISVESIKKMSKSPKKMQKY